MTGIRVGGLFGGLFGRVFGRVFGQWKENVGQDFSAI